MLIYMFIKYEFVKNILIFRYYKILKYLLRLITIITIV
jgi:hypothetical protein